MRTACQHRGLLMFSLIFHLTFLFDIRSDVKLQDMSCQPDYQTLRATQRGRNINAWPKTPQGKFLALKNTRSFLYPVRKIGIGETCHKIMTQIMVLLFFKYNILNNFKFILWKIIPLCVYSTKQMYKKVFTMSGSCGKKLVA